MFGNKLAILAGDFILARASVGLARLRSLDTVCVFIIAATYFRVHTHVYILSINLAYKLTTIDCVLARGGVLP